MYLLAGLIPAVLGLCGPYLVTGLEDAEQVIPELARLHLGTGAYVLFAGALISAILSTVDSTLLAGSALLTHNIVLQLRPDLSDRARLLWSRAGVFTLGIIAGIIALLSDSIADLVSFSSSFGSAGIFVVGTLGLFTNVGGVASALAALITGMVVWAVGAFVLQWQTPYTIALVAAFCAYLLAAPFGSRRVAVDAVDQPG